MLNKCSESVCLTTTSTSRHNDFSTTDKHFLLLIIQTKLCTNCCFVGISSIGIYPKSTILLHLYCTRNYSLLCTLWIITLIDYILCVSFGLCQFHFCIKFCIRITIVHSIILCFGSTKFFTCLCLLSCLIDLISKGIFLVSELRKFLSPRNQQSCRFPFTSGQYTKLSKCFPILSTIKQYCNLLDQLVLSR